MVISSSGNIQDTLRQRILVSRDSSKQKTDSLAVNDTVKITDSLSALQPADNTFQPPRVKQDILLPAVPADTELPADLCTRNPVADVTFTDSTSFVFFLDPSVNDSFPGLFTGKTASILTARKMETEKIMREGMERETFHRQTDWVIPVVLLSVFLWSIVRRTSAGTLRSFMRYISFRNVNDPSARDTSALFYWQSSTANLGAFMGVALFAWTSLRYAGLSFGSIPDSVIWLICLLTVALAVSLRHVLGIVTGSVSGEIDLFREYTVSVYDFYRVGGIVLAVISLVILYVKAIPANIAFSAGLAVALSLYAVRVIRLFFIFITRHISLLYLILYLCALEILPVLVLVKYFTGLV